MKIPPHRTLSLAPFVAALLCVALAEPVEASNPDFEGRWRIDLERSDPMREGLVSMNINDLPAIDLVEELNNRGIRTHVRKADHYSGNILDPLGLPSCVRVSMCHYNSLEEVSRFLAVVKEIHG